MAKVLIIDDDQDVSRLLVSHLTDEGHQVTVSHHGEDGVTQAQKLVPELIMLDVFLPDATGFQICNQLRKNSITHSIPIIMMTGAARFPNQQMYGRERGANEYIFKPFNIMDITELVRKYIQPASKSSVATPPMEPVPIRFESPEFDVPGIVELHAREIQPVAENTEPAPPPASVGHAEGLKALSSFLKNSLSSINARFNGEPVAEHPKEETPVEPLPDPPPIEPEATAPILPVPLEKVLAVTAMEPIPDAVQTALQNPFADIAGLEQRCIDFSLEVFHLASRLSSTQGERYLADQLLRCGMSLGWRIQEAGSAASQENASALLKFALQELRETGYWLMMTDQAKLLQKLSKLNLLENCESLKTLLSDYLNSEMSPAPRS